MCIDQSSEVADSLPRYAAFEHARVDEVGTNTGGVYARPVVRRQFVGEAVREADTAELGRAVVHELRTSNKASNTRYVDDVAVVPLQHRRQETLHGLARQGSQIRLDNYLVKQLKLLYMKFAMAGNYSTIGIQLLLTRRAAIGNPPG